MTHPNPRRSAAPLDPEKAIWKKDLAELNRALEAGWTLPYVHAKNAGLVEDLSLVIRVVSLRWVEGWKALANRFPEIRENQVLRSLAIRQAVSGIVEDLIEHGMDPSVPLAVETDPFPLHLLQEAMGPRPGDPVYEEDILATAQLLVAAGADPTLPHDGDFSPGDPLPGGHCFWTRALFYGHWRIVRAFVPGSWDELSSWPRGKEMFNDLRKVYESGRVLGAEQVWTELLVRWMGPWLESSPQEWFAFPKDLEIIPELPATTRALVWKRWDQIDELGWTGLHEMAISAKNPAASRVLILALEEKAACLRRWEHPDAEGMRPCDLWEIAYGRPPLQEATLIQDVLSGDSG